MINSQRLFLAILLVITVLAIAAIRRESPLSVGVQEAIYHD